MTLTNSSAAWRNSALLGAFLLVFVGFHTSRGLMSAGVIALCLLGLTARPLRETFHAFLADRATSSISLFFLLLFFSGINSSDKTQWLVWLRITSIFLFMPIAFAGLEKFPVELVQKILRAFVLTMIISVAIVLGYYGLHFREINASIVSGGAIPVPFSHIRYNLLVVFGFFCAWWLAQRQTPYRKLWLAAALLLFVAVHVLSARSGWLALYACLLFCLVQWLWLEKKWLLSIVLFAALPIVPYTAYRLLPSVQNKVGYMLHDYREFQQRKIDGHSDGMRFASWEVGIEMIRENFWTGVGVGDMEAQARVVSRRLYPGIMKDENRKQPHNLFIWIFAATGIVGFLVFCWSFFFPFVSNFAHHDWLLPVLFIIFFTSFITEYPLLEQVGSAFYCVFLLLLLKRETRSPS